MKQLFELYVFWNSYEKCNIKLCMGIQMMSCNLQCILVLRKKIENTFFCFLKTNQTNNNYNDNNNCEDTIVQICHKKLQPICS